MNHVRVAHPLTHLSVPVCYSSCCFHTSITSSLPGFAFVHLRDWQYTHDCNQNVNPHRDEARQTGCVCIAQLSTMEHRRLSERALVGLNHLSISNLLRFPQKADRGSEKFHVQAQSFQFHFLSSCTCCKKLSTRHTDCENLYFIFIILKYSI